MTRPKKYDSHFSTRSANFYIHPTFEDAWKKITELSKIDKDKGFLEHISKIEGEDVKKSRLQGKRGLYIRWILTKHVMENLSKLIKIKKDERKINTTSVEKTSDKEQEVQG